MLTAPRCPFCNAQGVSQLEAKTIGFFAVIYCRQCGAIHGVVPKPQDYPKPVETPKSEPVAPEPKALPEPFDIRKIDVEKKPPEIPKPPPAEPKKEQNMTPERARAMMPYYTQPGSTMYKIIRKDDEEEG